MAWLDMKCTLIFQTLPDGKCELEDYIGTDNKVTSIPCLTIQFAKDLMKQLGFTTSNGKTFWSFNNTTAYRIVYEQME